MQAKETLFDITRLVLRHRRTILRNVIIAGIVAIVMSLLLKNYYKATTVFYPASADLMKPELVFGTSNKDIEYYGTGVDLDRLLTVANSNDLYDFMIDSFNLYSLYDIDSTTKNARYKAGLRFSKHYSIQKTKLDAVELSIEDRDPRMAAAMSNAARDRINFLVSKMVKSNLSDLAVTIQSNIVEKQREVIVLSDSMEILRKKFNIIDPEIQAEMLTTKLLNTESKLERERARLEVLQNTPNVRRDTITLLRAMVAGLDRELQILTDTGSRSGSNLTNFNKGRSIVEVLSSQLRAARDYLTVYNTRYNQVTGVLNSKSTAIHLVEKAEVPLIKVRPRRSLIVLSVVGAAFLFSVIGVVFIDSIKDPEWKRLWNE